MRILLAEDDDLMQEFVRRYLCRHGFRVEITCRGDEALRLASNTSFDAIILDIGLPNMDGLEVCQALREQNVQTPIIILSARSSEKDKIKGLRMGADDYLAKPFNYEELHLRVISLTRRSGQISGQFLEVRHLCIDTSSRRVWVGEDPIKLRPKEYDLLLYLARNCGSVLSRRQILNNVWGVADYASSNRVESCVSRLRKKVDSPKGFHPKLIHNIRGVGYRLD